MFTAILIALAGLLVAVVLSFFLSIALEMLLSIGMLHAAMGGMGAFIMVPLAFVAELIGLAVGAFTGATGWALFFSPIIGCCIAFVLMGILWGGQRLLGEAPERKNKGK